MSLFAKYMMSSSPYVPPLYPDYKVGIFKVIDNFVDGDLSANTGLAFDTTRRLIYSGITPMNSISTGIYVYDEDYVFQGQLPIVSIQGFTYDENNDRLIVWSQGGANAFLRTYDLDGTLIYSQSNFDPYENGSSSGSLGYNHVDDEMAITTDGGNDVLIFVRSGNDWVKDRTLGVSDAEEGVTYDDDSDCYWYNTTTQIVKISKTGNILKRIPQVDETINVNEGIAYNRFRKTLYVNSDKGFHGGVPDGNRCVELYPDFY